MGVPVVTKSEWQVVIGDYADANEAASKLKAAAKAGFLTTEIFGQPGHQQMRLVFPTKAAADQAAAVLKEKRISHEPEVIPYRH